MPNNKNINIALIVGGASAEREVSKLTGKNIYEALLSLEYNVKVIDPAYGCNQPENIEHFFDEQNHFEINTQNYVRAVNSDLFDNIDVAFNALHGPWGEDGTIQSLFELRGLKYTGSKVLGSAVAMDKMFSKISFEHFKVNTPWWFLIEKEENNIESIVQKINSGFGFPCVIKPNNQGSTVGLTICKNENQISDALELSRNHCDKALVEEFISGYELTVGVLDKKCFEPLEIKPKSGFYDYESKYTPGMSEYEVPANFPINVLTALKEQAYKAFLAVGAEDFARVDFRLSEKHIPYCLEVNTLPGMTSTSLLPKAAKVDGISYEQLVDKIVKLALK
ncbi:MAG: D-alanine--D-alanine ligase [Ignavibacteria bacterium]